MIRKSIGVGLLFLAAACGGEVTDTEEETLGTESQAIVGGVRATAYASAALLDMRAANGAGYRCSAALIAPTVVLTAGHCVDGMVSWTVTVGNNVRQASRGETFDWNEHGATTVYPFHHDIGLVYLTVGIVLPAYPAIASAPLVNDSTVANVGRVLNGVVTNTLYTASVKVRAGSAIGYAFDYYSPDVIEHGDSGGPVFAANTQTIVAVNSGAGGSLQVLARTDLLQAWIRGRIASKVSKP